MLSKLKMAWTCGLNRKYLVGLVVVAIFVAYTIGSQFWTTRSIKPQEAGFESTLNKELKLASRFDRESDNGALQTVVTTAAPSSPSPISLPLLTRKIIRNGSFAVTVKAFDTFFTELRSQASIRGGFIAQVQANRGAGWVSAAQIVVRIQPEQVDAFTSWLRDQGTLTSEQLTSEDISEQYFDLSARLQNARRFEMRLLEMLRTQTGKLQDLVLVEEKLNQIREQIEQFEGKIRLYDHLTGLATLTLSVRVEEHYVVSHPPTFSELVLSTWRNSTHVLRECLEVFTLTCVAITPWIPFLLVLVITIWLLQRRLLSGLRRKQTV